MRGLGCLRLPLLQALLQQALLSFAEKEDGMEGLRRRLDIVSLFGDKQGMKTSLTDDGQKQKLIGNRYFPDDGPYMTQANYRVKTLLPEQGRVLVDCLGWIHDRFENAGIHYAAMYGTLLGVHRSNGIVPWTSDADLVVATEDTEKVRWLGERMAAEPNAEHKVAFAFGDCDGPGIRFHCQGHMKELSEEEIADIKPDVLKEKDKPVVAEICADATHVDIWTHRPKEELELLEYFPTETVSFYDRSLRVPVDRAKVLQHHYGRDCGSFITKATLLKWGFESLPPIRLTDFSRLPLADASTEVSFRYTPPFYPGTRKVVAVLSDYQTRRKSFGCRYVQACNLTEKQEGINEGIHFESTALKIRRTQNIIRRYRKRKRKKGAKSAYSKRRRQGRREG